MTKNLLSLYGLKWNPLSPELPVEALLATPSIENFVCLRQHCVNSSFPPAVMTSI